MNTKDFFKLVGKFIIIFTLVIWTIFGVIYLAHGYITGNYNLTKSIQDIANKYTEKPLVNALILGTDKGEALTDTIVFVSYNPNTYKINAISIPRDTKVNVNGNKKINSLYAIGKEQLVIQNVEKIINLPINFYAVVNLKGFREIVDSLGGIPINVAQDMNYTDPYQDLVINIKKGYQVLDGIKAEGFVRYRSGYSDADLGRIRAQHQFINAAAAQLMQAKNITKVPALINIVLKNVKTNVTNTDILPYLDDVAKIKMENIKISQLPGEAKYIGEASYFVHDPVKVQALVDEMTSKVEQPTEQLTEQQKIERNKKYNVEVLNGTSIPGLAMNTATELKAKGFNIKNVGNSEEPYSKTKIINKSSEKAGQYVKEVFEIGQVTDEIEKTSEIDVILIIGADYKK